MASRIVIAGELWFGTRPPDPTIVLESYPRLRGPDGTETRVCGVQAITTDSPDSPFRLGIPYLDPEENVIYRVVGIHVFQDVAWQSISFWMERWHCKHETFFLLCGMGWIDCALADKSALKRYRCRDEVRVLEYLEKLREQARIRTEIRKTADAARAARKKR